MSRNRESKRQARIGAVRAISILQVWDEAIKEDVVKTRKAAWLRSPHPFWSKRQQRMAGK